MKNLRLTYAILSVVFLGALTDATLAENIARGGRGVNKSVLMPAYQTTLSQEQIQYVVGYIRTFTVMKF